MTNRLISLEKIVNNVKKSVRVVLVKGLVLFFICCSLVLCFSCGVAQQIVEGQHAKGDAMKFPRYFAMRSSLICRHLKRIHHLHIEVDIAFDKKIHFIVKGPLSSVLLRGIVTKQGITLSDPLHFRTYELSYEHIRQQHAFCLNYALIQSLLLGTTYNESVKAKLKGKTSEQGDFLRYLSYTYDKHTKTLLRTQLVDLNKKYHINFFYRYNQKSTKQKKYCFNNLSSIDIELFCQKAMQLQKSSLVLPKLTFWRKVSFLF